MSPSNTRVWGAASSVSTTIDLLEIPYVGFKELHTLAPVLFAKGSRLGLGQPRRELAIISRARFFLSSSS